MDNKFRLIGMMLGTEKSIADLQELVRDIDALIRWNTKDEYVSLIEHINIQLEKLVEYIEGSLDNHEN